jgi:hypothetical protein
VIERVGPFDEELTPVEDWAYHIRCAAAGARFRLHDEEGARPLVRVTPGSSSSDPRRMLRAEILMRRRVRRVLEDEDVSRLNENRLAEVTGLLGVEEHLHGRRGRAVTQFVKAGGLDRRARPRAKWLLCAAVGLFAKHRHIQKLVHTSLSDAAGGVLRRG